MTDEPIAFEDFGSYMRVRTMIAAGILLRKSGSDIWHYGHQKLLGIILWNYETTKEPRFKYRRLLKRYAYCKTQNYKLMRPMLDRKVLVRQGHGYYTFSKPYEELIQRIFQILKDMDEAGNPDKKEEG